jgi:hypothetical protein
MYLTYKSHVVKLSCLMLSKKNKEVVTELLSFEDLFFSFSGQTIKNI